MACQIVIITSPNRFRVKFACTWKVYDLPVRKWAKTPLKAWRKCKLSSISQCILIRCMCYFNSELFTRSTFFVCNNNNLSIISYRKIKSNFVAILCLVAIHRATRNFHILAAAPRNMGKWNLFSSVIEIMSVLFAFW